MGKPAPKPTWFGTSGNDVKVVASLAELKTTTYDAGAGYDTLDLSALTSGVSISFSQTTQGRNVTLHSQLWADTPFHGSWWGMSLQGATDTVDTIKNFEKIVGTGFNDYINLSIANVARVADGGPGDDAIYVGGVGGSNTSIGGLGSDQLFGSRPADLLIGGTFDGAHATPDNTPDEFFMSGGTVLDFEVGTDHLYIDNEMMPLAASWIDVNTSYGAAAQLLTAYGTTITLVGVSASTMNSIPAGFTVQSSSPGDTLTSGPGDDFIWDHATNVPTTYVFGSGSGHDLLNGIDLNYDTLVFPDAPTATNTTYHGDPAVLLTFDGGNSSVLLIDVTSADLSHIAMQYPAAAQATHELLGLA